MVQISFRYIPLPGGPPIKRALRGILGACARPSKAPSATETRLITRVIFQAGLEAPAARAADISGMCPRSAINRVRPWRVWLGGVRDRLQPRVCLETNR